MPLICLTKGRGPVCSLSFRGPPLYRGLSAAALLPTAAALVAGSTSALLAMCTRGLATAAAAAARGDAAGEAKFLSDLCAAAALAAAGEGPPTRFFREGALCCAAAFSGLRPFGAPAVASAAAPGAAGEAPCGAAGEVTVPCLVTTIFAAAAAAAAAVAVGAGCYKQADRL